MFLLIRIKWFCNKVFEYLNNVVGKFSVLYKIKREDIFFIIFIRSSLWIRL